MQIAHTKLIVSGVERKFANKSSPGVDFVFKKYFNKYPFSAEQETAWRGKKMLKNVQVDVKGKCSIMLKEKTRRAKMHINSKRRLLGKTLLSRRMGWHLERVSKRAHLPPSVAVVITASAAQGEKRCRDRVEKKW